MKLKCNYRPCKGTTCSDCEFARIECVSSLSLDFNTIQLDTVALSMLAAVAFGNTLPLKTLEQRELLAMNNILSTEQLIMGWRRLLGLHSIRISCIAVLPTVSLSLIVFLVETVIVLASLHSFILTRMPVFIVLF